MKTIIFTFLCSSFIASAGSIYQCENEFGTLAYQELPCEGETLQIINDAEQKHQVMFTQAMIQTLSQLTQKKRQEYNNSKKLKAIEVLAMTDAAKSHAFTQIYAVSAKHCGREVEAKLLKYKNQASEILALGAYYYSQGIEAIIDGKDFSQSGKDLTEALLEMTQKLDQEHQNAAPSQLAKKCKEASQNLTTLTFLYSN